MRDHAQFAEDLALYAMGALDDQACPELQAHLGACGECRRELQALRADLALLAVSATGPQPPQRSRRRLMDAIATNLREDQEDRKIKALPVPRRTWPRPFTFAPVVAALALIAICIAQFVQIDHLKHALFDEQRRSAQAKAVLEMLDDPSAQQMTLVAAARRPPRIKTIYQKKKGHILLIADSLDPIPEDKVYQLWLMPANGGNPMPCGTFRIDSQGNSVMMHAMDDGGVDAKAFAVTEEPVGGSKTPTMPVVYGPAG